MQLDNEKLKNLIEDEAKSLGVFCNSNFFIGEINGKPVLVSVMTQEEAINTHYYDGLESVSEELICIKE